MQFELDGEPTDRLLGRFCYWIRGTQVGEFDLRTSLQDVLGLLARKVKDNGKRAAGKLYDVPADELCALLDSALYGAEEESEAQAVEEQWERFQIDMPLDVFDECRVYLLECGKEARILVEHLGTDVITDYRVDAGAFDSAVADAFAAILELDDEPEDSP